MSIKKGDIVGRKSYGKDIFFIVDKILKSRLNKEFAILKGLNIRVLADSPMEDLEVISKQEVIDSVKLSEIDIERRINNSCKYKTDNKLIRQRVYTGKILHLDGDRKYSEKSTIYYKKMGLNAAVRNIPENKQPKVVYRLLQIYNPDILVITRARWYD